MLSNAISPALLKAPTQVLLAGNAVAQVGATTTDASSAVVEPTPLGILLAVFFVLSIVAYLAAYLVRPVHLALGFATTAAMWGIGYVSMMAPGLWIGEALFVLTLAVPVIFGAIAMKRPPT